MSINLSSWLQHYKLYHFRLPLFSHHIYLLDSKDQLKLDCNVYSFIRRGYPNFSALSVLVNTGLMAGMFLLSPTARECLRLWMLMAMMSPCWRCLMHGPLLGSSRAHVAETWCSKQSFHSVLQKLWALSLPLIFLSFLAIFSPSPSPLPSMSCWCQSQNKLGISENSSLNDTALPSPTLGTWG